MSPLQALLAAVGSEGRTVLMEHEAYEIAAALGLAVPAHLVAPRRGAVPSLEGLPGERLVVKVLSPEMPHKSSLGGVRLVPREAVEGAVAEMACAFDGADLRGFLVAECIEHAPEGEILLGWRRTRDFGPVVAVGLGGSRAERLAEAAPPTLFSADEGYPGWLRARCRPPAGRPRSQWTTLAEVAPGALDELLRRFLHGVGRLPAEVAEFEVNPLVFAGGRPVALDALARLGPSAPLARPRPAAQIGRLLRPQSIAVVGVSERVNPGRVILRNILAAGFPPDRVTVVKPGSRRIEGCRCVPDLASLPGPVDLAVLSIAAAAVPGALEEIVALGCARAVIVVPGGLGERPGSEALAERARAAVEQGRRRGGGPVVNGANSMGIRSVPGRYDATFIPGYKSSPDPGAPPAPLAVVSQSGAFAIARLDRLLALRPRYLITVGNQIDLTVGDYVEALADDPSVEVVACYVEGFRPGDGAHLLGWARRLVDRDRAVVAYLAGRTAQGAASAASHTASVAPDHAVARALAEQAGVLMAETMEEFEDLVRLAVALAHRSVAGLRLGAVSNAGFEVVSIADHAGPMTLARFGDDTASRVQAVLEAQGVAEIVAVGNPLDLTPMTGDESFAEAAAAILADPGVDVGIVGCVPLTPALATLPAGAGHGEDLAAPGALAGRLIDLWRSSSKAWVIVVDGGARYDPLAGRLEQAGLPVFRTADRAAAALGRYCYWRAWGRRSGSGGASSPLTVR